MLDISNLNVSIQSTSILRDVSLTVDEGTMVGLVGRNGAGKTTLMKSIMGLLKAESGTMSFNGDNLLETPIHKRIKMGIGYMPEDRRLIPDLTVRENLLLPAWAGNSQDSEARLDYIVQLIPELVAFGPRRGTQLSGGQQKLVALGRSLMTGTKLLLLDEPFEGVAPALAQRLVEVISGLKKEGMTVIFSESDLQHSVHMVQKIFTIDRGELREKIL
jgi:branched-chain amino acid transport system ATP-binding protein